MNKYPKSSFSSIDINVKINDFSREVKKLVLKGLKTLEKLKMKLL